MKKFRTAAALILALALALSLAGCGTAMSDASAMLVQGNLDEIYLGKFDPDSSRWWTARKRRRKQSMRTA